jgi:diadenosine tetraphosphate (Ap4A) HIT family hydrolase
MGRIGFMSIECPYCEKLVDYDFGDPLIQTEHWIVFLAPNQSNLATCVVALKRDQPEPHLHWHFIPRYNHPVNFAGHTFEDPHFGYMRPRPPKNISYNVRQRIAEKIREYL